MDRYFEWLKNRVDFLDFPECYDRLFNRLHEMPFRWRHPMDKNRATEALALRLKYSNEIGKKINFLTNMSSPSVFELLISISEKMNFICSSFDEDKTKIIFWRLLSNLELSDMSDPNYERFGGNWTVDMVLNRFLDREYDVDGRNGGLFPMINPRENQREVELWYQMNQYLSDPNGEDLKSY